MNGGRQGVEIRSRSRGYPRLALWLAAAALLLLIFTVAFVALYPGDVGKQQPIPFSHRVHAGDKQIGCFLCHPDSLASARAGVPSLDTCLLCHSKIIVTHPQIRNLQHHYDTGEPVQWVRVNDLPEFVYFSHEMHLNEGFDCGGCHGDVKTMDRIVPKQEFTMGFCVQCHRDNGASHDCLTCHR